MQWELVLWSLSCRKHQLCNRSRQCVTCGPPSGAGVMLGGAGLANSRFHHAPPEWGLSLSLRFFGKVSLPYYSYIIRRNRVIDKRRETQE